MKFKFFIIELSPKIFSREILLRIRADFAAVMKLFRFKLFF